MSVGTVPIPYPLVPPAPDYEKKTTGETTTTGGTNTETKTLSPEQQAALKGTEAAAQGAIDVEGQKAAQAGRVASENADAADKGAIIAGNQQRATLDALTDSRADIDAHRAKTRELEARFDKMPPASFFRTGDTWGNVLRGWSLAMGGIGDAMQIGAAIRAHQAPPKLDSVFEIINHDLEGQKQVRAEMADKIAMARTGEEDAQKARQQFLAEVDLKGVKAYEYLDKLTRARLAAIGLSQPEIDKNAAVQAINQKLADAKAEYVKPLYQTISKKVETSKKAGVEETNRLTSAKPNAENMQAAMQAPALAEAYKSYAGYNPGMLEGVTPHALKDAEGQTAEASEARLKAAVLGELASKRGIMGEPAEKMWGDMYQVKPSDSAETKRFKRENLLRDLDAATMGGVSNLLGPKTEAPKEGKSAKEAESKAREPVEVPHPPEKPKAAPEDARSRTIRMLKQDPNRPGAKFMMGKYNITEADLRG